MTSSDSSFCRFFSRMLTTSVAVQAPSARSTNSIGPGALLDSRSESIATAWPDGPMATNFSSPIHFTDALCMQPPCERISGAVSEGRAVLNLMLVIRGIKVAEGPSNQAVRRELPPLESTDAHAMAGSSGTRVGPKQRPIKNRAVTLNDELVQK